MANFFSRSNNDMKYLFRNKDVLNKKELKRKRRAKSTIFGLILVLIQLVATVLFLMAFYKLDILPTKYMIMLTAILVLFLLYDFTSQFTKITFIGKILAILLSIVLFFGYTAGENVNNMFTTITHKQYSTDVIDLIVLKNDSASTIKDTLSYGYGYNQAIEKDVIKDAIKQVEDKNNAKINAVEFSDWTQLVNALYDNTQVKLLIVSDSMKTTIAETDPDFNNKTRVLDTLKITTQVEVEQAEVKAKGEPFIIYISGNDDFGETKDAGHSDVNILATINPETRQVLLISTPRDYYINITRANGASGKDKLTHSCNDGIKYAQKAISDLYGVKIDYYMRINFDGCINIVDALGGITVDSGVEFSNGEDAYDKTFHFNKGLNDLTGEMTLAFVRERHAFVDGDLQRGRDQEAAIKGIIDKATSPAIIANYSEVLEAVSQMMITNMPTASITNLIKEQISDSTAWNIQSYSVGASDIGMYYLNIYNFTASCVIPDYDTVNLACDMINKVYNDEVFDVDAYVEQHTDPVTGKINYGETTGLSSTSTKTTVTSTTQSPVSR